MHRTCSMYFETGVEGKNVEKRSILGYFFRSKSVIRGVMGRVGLILRENARESDKICFRSFAMVLVVFKSKKI